MRGLKAHLGFGLAFGCVQLVYQLLLSDLLPVPHLSREKTVVVFDASGINDANPSATMDFSTPLHVSTFGPDGKRTDNDWEKAKVPGGRIISDSDKTQNTTKFGGR